MATGPPRRLARALPPAPPGLDRGQDSEDRDAKDTDAGGQASAGQDGAATARTNQVP